MIQEPSTSLRGRSRKGRYKENLGVCANRRKSAKRVIVKCVIAKRVIAICALCLRSFLRLRALALTSPLTFSLPFLLHVSYLNNEITHPEDLRTIEALCIASVSLTRIISNATCLDKQKCCTGCTNTLPVVEISVQMLIPHVKMCFLKQLNCWKLSFPTKCGHLLQR